MVIDSSALMAVLRREPEEQDFRNAIEMAASRLPGASTRVETGIVALAKATGEPLLFKGDDFSQTDIRRAA